MDETARTLDAPAETGPSAGGSVSAKRTYGALRILGNLLAAIWIFGGTVFFLLRFSAIFYHANQSAIDAFLQHIVL